MIDDIKTNSQRGSVNIGAKVGLQDSKFEGFDDLTTTTLNNLKGTRAVQKRHIENLLKMPQLKQAEKDIIGKVLAEYEGAVIPVQEFADKVKTELLPLERLNATKPGSGYGSSEGRWDDYQLPYELRGDSTNYQEHIYNSPIETSAGNTHFSGNENAERYFAHVRTDDLIGDPLPIGKSAEEYYTVKPIDDATAPAGSKPRYGIYTPTDGRVNMYNTFDTPEEAAAYIKTMPNPTKQTIAARRILEMQSDLFQKGKLENEFGGQNIINLREDLKRAEEQASTAQQNLVDYPKLKKAMKAGKLDDLPFEQKSYWSMSDEEKEQLKKTIKERTGAGDYVTNQVAENINASKDEFLDRLEKITNKENVAEGKQLWEKHNSRATELREKIKVIEEGGTSDYDRLAAYKNTWHQRLLREQIKLAAEDGAPVMQVPTGRTIAQIEKYLGEEGGARVPRDAVVGDTFEGWEGQMRIIEDFGDEVKAVPENAIKNEFDFDVARQEELDNMITDIQYEFNNGALDDWNVRMVLDKLSADDRAAIQALEEGVDLPPELSNKVEKATEEFAQEEIESRFTNADEYADYASENFGSKYIHTGDDNIIELEEGYEPEHFDKGITDDMSDEEVRDSLNSDQQRVFDFYEKDIPKYLKKLYPNLERIFDDNGVEWWQLPVDPAKAKEPVDAFAKKKEEEDQPQPVYA